MLAAPAGAGSGEAEDFRRWNRAGDGEKFARNLEGSRQVADPRLVERSLDDPKGHGPFH
jgi:hypothetical protein